jgi:hypothetical protein
MVNVVTPRQAYGYNPAATTYDGANEALDVSSALDTLDATATPLLALIGRDSLSKPATNVKHEWMEDSIIGASATSTDADLNNTSTGVVTLTVAAGEGLKFRGYGTTSYTGAGPCDVLRITSTAGEELAICLGSTSTTVIVERGYASWSTPVDHTGVTKTITVIGSMQPQGLHTVGSPRTTLKVPLYNYTQIFEDSFEQAATQRVTGKILSVDDLSHEQSKIVKRFGQAFERTLIYGKRQAPAASTGSTMDGIRARISTNVYDKAGAKLTSSMLEDALVAAWNNDDGMQDRYVIVGAIQRRVIGQMLDSYRQVGYSDKTFGTSVNRFETDFGGITVVLDRYMPDDEVLILDTSRIGFGPLQGRALSQMEIPPTSKEYRQWQWTGEYTSEVRQESVHARIYDLATTNVL